MTAGQPGGSFGTVFHPGPDPVPPGNGGPVRPGQLRALPRRRRPGMIALAVALIGAGVLGGAALFRHVDHQYPVLMVTAVVPAGTVVTAADIGTTTVAAGPGLQVIPARQERQVVGLVAATNLRPGTLLASADLTQALPPRAGQVLVPLPLKPSELPASGLSAGDHLMVVPAPGAPGSGGAPAATGRPVAGIVEAVSRGPDTDGFEVVDLLVPAGSGPDLAKEAAAGGIALVVTSRVP